MPISTIINDAELRERLQRVPNLQHSRQYQGSEYSVFWYDGLPQPGNTNLIARLSIAVDEKGLPHTLVSYEGEGLMLRPV